MNLHRQVLFTALALVLFFSVGTVQATTFASPQADQTVVDNVLHGLPLFYCKDCQPVVTPINVLPKLPSEAGYVTQLQLVNLASVEALISRGADRHWILLQGIYTALPGLPPFECDGCCDTPIHCCDATHCW